MMNINRTNRSVVYSLILSLPFIALNRVSGACIAVIAYGKNPETGKWEVFPTPCDVPKGWEQTTSKPPELIEGHNGDNKTCQQVITYAQPPSSQNWYIFPTPCDIPVGWKTSSEKPEDLLSSQNICLPVVTYAQNPETRNWYAFSTSCDVPTGWMSSATPPKEFSEDHCSSFYATYSGTTTEGKLHIPLISYDIGTGDKINFKAVELELLPIPNSNLLLFFLPEIPELAPN